MCFPGWRYIVIVNLVGMAAGCSCQAPPTPEQVLERLGVEASAPSLRRSLSDPRPDVRALAAGELILKKTPGAEDWVYQASEKERDPKVLLTSGRMLTWAGDQRGESVTLRACHLKTTEPGLRLQALEELGAKADSQCVRGVESLAPELNPSGMLGLLNFSLEHQQLFTDGSLHSKAVVLGVQSPVPPVRIAAAECASQFKMKAILGTIRNALARETDPEAREKLAATVASLSQ